MKKYFAILNAARKVRACRNSAVADGELTHFEIDFVGSCGPAMSRDNLRGVLEYLTSIYDEYVGSRVSAIEILCYTMTEEKAADYYRHGGQWVYHWPERL